MTRIKNELHEFFEKQKQQKKETTKHAKIAKGFFDN